MHILDGRNLTDNSVEGILGEAERLARGVHEAGESPERHAAWARADIPQCRALQTLPMLTSLEFLNLDIDTVTNMKHNIHSSACLRRSSLTDGLIIFVIINHVMMKIVKCMTPITAWYMTLKSG